MSRKKNRNQFNGQCQEKHQSMYKVSPKFAEYVESYSEQLYDAIEKLYVASKNGQEVPKNLVLKGIEEVEIMRDDDLFHALKDGEMDLEPTESVTQMLKLLKQALTVTASGEATKLDLSDTASFRQFAALKVPGGRDTYSSMQLPKLITALGNSGDFVQDQIQTFWQHRNETDKGKNYLFTEKELKSVLRWHLRGLSVGAAVRKVRVDYEITQNCFSV